MTASFAALPKIKTFRIEIIVGAELKLPILLDLDVNYGSRTVPPIEEWFSTPRMALGEQLQNLALAAPCFA